MSTGDKLFIFKALGISTLFFIVVFSGFWYAINYYDLTLKQKQQFSQDEKLTSTANTLTQIINHRFALLYGVRAFVLSNPDYFDKQQNHPARDTANFFLKELYSSISDIRNVTIAPGGIHQYIYPDTEYAKMFGHNLLTDKRAHVHRKILQTIKDRKIGINGPYPLRQDGSLGLVARLPIYQKEKFWGFVTMVLDVSEMLKVAGLTSSDHLALRNTTTGDVFYGSAGTFAANPTITSITLPEGKWQITHTIVASGLSTSIKTTLLITIGLLALLSSSFLFFIFIRRRYLQSEIEKATKEITVQGEKLRESEEHLRTIFEAADNVAFVTTDLGGEGTIIRSFSPGAEKMFEYPAQEVIGQRVAILHPKRDWENFPTMQLALKQGKKGFSGESNLLRKSGEQFPVLFTIHPLRDSLGEVIGTLGVTFDITDRKHAEQERQTLKEQLHQKHKMEAVGYMAGGMAHNFNNNLAIILGNIELTQLKSQDPNVQELLKNAKVAIMRSKDLVNKIITYSRKGVQNKAPMLLLTIINETISLLGPTLPTTITLQKNIDPSCDSNFINADPSQIQEVLVNSINNAVQAMDEKGELIISLTPVELEEKDIPPQYEAIPGSYANLSIQDTGCGMPAEIVAKIFDPFFTTKEDYEGAGMGLSTVQGIVAQHGGLIKVSSILARGTIFNIYFPITNETAKETKPSNEDMPKGTERILFVDDDTTLANLGEQLLAKSGYQVTAMTSSQEALKLFQANPNQFDLVITDQTMPELTGAELIEKLKQINLKVPTILCTGFSSKVDEDKARELGLSAFMIKPLVLPELLQTIRQVLDGEKE